MTAVIEQAASSPKWRRAWEWLFALEPMRHAWWETTIMRGIIAWAAWFSLAFPAQWTGQPHPHGLAVWGVDFSWLGDPALAPKLHLMVNVCLVLYVFCIPEWVALLKRGTGWVRQRAPVVWVMVWLIWVVFWLIGLFPQVLTLLPVLVCSIGHGVLGNSQGAIGHSTQILTVALLAQWLAYAWACLQPRTRWSMPHGFNSSQLAADWGRQAVAAGYVVSAISKLIASGGDWISDTPYFGLQVVKSNGMGFYDYLAPRTEGWGVWLGQWLVDHPFVTAVVLTAALPLELFAFLALNNRRIALFFGVALYLFHSTVTEVMQLGFLYHRMLLFALFINPVWWVVQGLRRLIKQKGESRNQMPTST
ncbi:MAG TPA: hypothetical protein VLE43_12880 [Candidatus Saccharimonadia bacterium]|nr:hypothetical protein [Candidatus Saccharimonadia bacterium]